MYAAFRFLPLFPAGPGFVFPFHGKDVLLAWIQDREFLADLPYEDKNEARTQEDLLEAADYGQPLNGGNSEDYSWFEEDGNSDTSKESYDNWWEENVFKENKETDEVN